MAIIDTGIDVSHPCTPPVVDGVRLSIGVGGTITQGDDWHDTVGHGTACAGVAARGLVAQLEMLAVRVVDDDGASTVRLLEAAIGWAVERRARVINISLGAPVWQEEARERMRAICTEALRRGAVVIAASGPDGTRALPAMLDEVIAVGSAVCPIDTLYVADAPPLDFLAKGDLQRIPWLEKKSVLGQGTSVAAAHVSNAVARILLREPSLDAAGVRAALTARSMQGDATARTEWAQRVDTFYRARTPARVGWLQRAAVYPFNKETHSLVRYRHLLPFSIEAVADPPGKRLSGRDAAEVLGEPAAGLPVLPSLQLALDRADAVVLGHLEALSKGGRDGSRSLLRELVRAAVDRGKGVYSFSHLRGPELSDLRAEAERRGVPCVDPTVSRAEAAPILHGAAAPSGDNPLRDPRLRSHGEVFRRSLASAQVYDCPVVAVFGTSRSQGKLSLQLGLRAALGELGYRVAHLATEPTGMLFGATVTLPTGYERGNDLSIDETAGLVNLLATEIKNREKCDLLLVGTQSSTIPVTPDFYRFGIGSLSTLALGAAVQPDACILVANPNDPPEHLERCRGALESVLHTRVLAVCFGDQVTESYAWKGVERRRQARLDDAALFARIAAWERHLGVPCFRVLSRTDHARLAELVADWFAAAAPDAELR